MKEWLPTLIVLAGVGQLGILIASALHDGRIGRDALTAFAKS